MAFVIDNPGNKGSKKRGFQFEDRVREHLRVSLPPAYGIFHSAIVESGPGDGMPRRDGPSARGPRRPPSPGSSGLVRPREVDFLVAGPNGLFVIEAKSQTYVRGSFWRKWAFSERHHGDKVAEMGGGKPFAEKLRENMFAAGDRVELAAWRLRPHAWTRGLFVFPDDAQIHLLDSGGQDAWDFLDGTMFVRRLSALPELLLSLRPPKGAPTGSASLTAEDARAILRLFDPGLRPDPNISGDYKILARGDYATAANGLSYAICELQHARLGYARRGKWYDMSALGQKDRRLFEAQIERHARVLASADGHPNVNRYYEFITDLVGDGYWVIEAEVAGETLAQLVAQGAPITRPVDFMRQVAAGLAAIHRGGFVCRGLNPGSILVERGTQKPVLTNFEVAKASDGGPTVTAGGDVPDDPFRAPELRVAGGGSGDTDARADVFSWGAIFQLVVGGSAGVAALPGPIAGLVERCLAPMKSQRPESMTTVLRDLEGAQ